MLLGSGCRDHPQREGTYTLHAREVLRDACGVWDSGALRPQTVTISNPGNEVFAELSPPPIPLWGRFLWEGQRFRVAGSLADQTLTVAGESCELSLLQAVLEAETEDDGVVVGARFTGRLTLEAHGRLGESCECLVEVDVEGVLEPEGG